MIPYAELTCAKCDTVQIVLPPTKGQVKGPDDATPRVELPRGPEGSRYVEADQDGWVTCANEACRERIEIPELRLS